MSFELPLLSDDVLARLRIVLSKIPESDQEDALQEAWVAHLEGLDVAKAVNAWQMSEARHRQRHVPLSSNQ